MWNLKLVKIFIGNLSLSWYSFTSASPSRILQGHIIPPAMGDQHHQTSNSPTFVNSSRPRPPPSPTASIIHAHLLHVQLLDLLMGGMHAGLELIFSKSGFYVSNLQSAF